LGLRQAARPVIACRLPPEKRWANLRAQLWGKRPRFCCGDQAVTRKPLGVPRSLAPRVTQTNVLPRARMAEIGDLGGGVAQNFDINPKTPRDLRACFCRVFKKSANACGQ
jgi:hypothetical protein